MVAVHSNEMLIEALEGATIVSGEIHDDEGMTLYLQDGRALLFVSSEFAVMLKRFSMGKLH